MTLPAALGSGNYGTIGSRSAGGAGPGTASALQGGLCVGRASSLEIALSDPLLPGPMRSTEGEQHFTLTAADF